MVFQIVIFSWIVTIFVTADIELQPIKSVDLQSAVESVKKDVDRHLQLMSDRLKLSSADVISNEEYIVSSKPSIKNDTVRYDESSIYGHPERNSDYSSDFESEMKVHPTETEDLQDIIHAVTIEIDRYLHLRGNKNETSDEISTVTEKPSTKDNIVVDDKTSPHHNTEIRSEYSSEHSEAEMKLLPTEDLQNIINSVTMEIDRYLHLKAKKDETLDEISVTEKPSTKDNIVVDDKTSLHQNTEERSEFSSHYSEAEIKLHTTMKEDLQNIVNSVTMEVDRHLQMRARKSLTNQSKTSGEEPTAASKPSTKDSTVVHDKTSVYDNSEESAEYLSDSSDVYYTSFNGRPGVDFPGYTHIPKTSFTCSGKDKIPGFYADMDTSCQVFHVCWPERRETFLCPLGTIFNQAISACDHWYNTDCSQSSYDAINSKLESDSAESEKFPMVNIPVQKTDSLIGKDPVISVMFFASEFMPVKAKIIVYPKTEEKRETFVASTGKTNVGLKTKPLKRFSSKNSVPRSVVYGRSSNYNLEKLKAILVANRLWEALHSVVKDIQNDNTYGFLYPYIQSIWNFIGVLFYDNKLPMMVNIERGTDLYEYDLELQNTIKWVEFFVKKYIARNWYVPHSSKNLKQEILYLNEETSKPILLTHLNPRFIVKPADTDIQLKNGEYASTLAKSRVKRTAPILHPLKQSLGAQVSIHPETKAALLKSYVMLYKAKYA